MKPNLFHKYDRQIIPVMDSKTPYECVPVFFAFIGLHVGYKKTNAVHVGSFKDIMEISL